MSRKKSKNRILFSLMPWLLCGSLTILVACQQGAQNNTGNTQTSGGGNTGDGGGGTGFNSKVYEQYITKLNSLEIWNTEISKVLTRTPSISYALESILERKVWLFVPQKLNRIDATKMGMEFRNDDFEQYAFQTDGEVWIDSAAFDSLSPETKSYLIFHEAIMDLYVLSKARKLDNSNSNEFAVIQNSYCQRLKEWNHSKKCDQPTHAKQKALYSLLTSLDYSKIREATHALMDTASGLSSDDILVRLLKLDFEESIVGSALRTEMKLERDEAEFKKIKGWIKDKAIESVCETKIAHTETAQARACLISLSPDEKYINIKIGENPMFQFPITTDRSMQVFKTKHLVSNETTVLHSYWVMGPENENGFSELAEYKVKTYYSGIGQVTALELESNSRFATYPIIKFTKIWTLAPGVGFDFSQ